MRKRIGALALLLTLSLFAFPCLAYADPADSIASGTWGTCPWEIDSTGKLTVHPGEGGESCVHVGDGFDSGNYSYWIDYRDSITSIAFVGEDGQKAVAREDSDRLFCGLEKVVSIDLAGLDTSNVERMRGLFEGCSSLTTLDLSGLSTSNVESMSDMFYGCSSLKALDLSSFDTSNVTGMGWMFLGCSSLTTLDLSGLSTSNVESMGGMFLGCSSLTTLDLSGLSTSNLREMGTMFTDCSSLKTLDLSSFDTSNVTGMDWMFDGCTSLETVYVGGLWTTDALDPRWTAGTFRGCTSLVGGNGTAFSTDHIDADYARIDKPGMPGYLTEKVSAEELAGAGRYDTAAIIAKKAYPDGADGVIIATGKDFPDALGASSLAGMLDWPILLTDPGNLSQAAYDAIVNLGAGEVIIVGGTGAVSTKVEQQLQGLVGGETNVKRVAGDNRYKTAEAIYEEGLRHTSWGYTAIVATGRDYPDALSISGFSFGTVTPIFLCDPKNGLTDGTKSALVEGEFEQIIIVGGTGAVPESAEAWLRTNVTYDVTRLAGSDRYETSREIAWYILHHGGRADRACIATGKNFPDALAGGPLVGKNATVLLLADPGKTTTLNMLSGYSGQIESIYYLGGIGAVPQSIRDAAELAAGLRVPFP